MNRREFMVSTVAVFAVAPLELQPKKIRIQFIGSLVFLPDTQTGRPIAHVALMNHDMHRGHLVLHKDHVAGGSAPTRDEFLRWQLPDTDPLRFADYRVWRLKDGFNITVTDRSPLSLALNKVVPMKTLCGSYTAQWRTKSWAYTTLTAGGLQDDMPRVSGHGHHNAEFKFTDDANDPPSPIKTFLTDVVDWRSESSTQPTFTVAATTVTTIGNDVRAWIIQTRDTKDEMKYVNEARHARAYYELCDTPVAAAKRRIPRRVVPVSIPPPPDVDPVFCPPGFFGL